MDRLTAEAVILSNKTRGRGKHRRRRIFGWLDMLRKISEFRLLPGNPTYQILRSLTCSNTVLIALSLSEDSR